MRPAYISGLYLTLPSSFSWNKNMKRSALQQKWKLQASKRTKVPYARPTVNQRAKARLALPELKAFDTAVNFLFDNTGEVPATGQLSLVQTGDAFNNRDGAVIQVKSLQLRGEAVYAPAAAVNAATTVYLYIVQDRQANGAAAAITDVLTSNDMRLALGNVPNQYRFKILKRIVLPLVASAGVTTAYNKVVVPVDEYLKFVTPIEMRYTASAGAITDVASNNIFLLAGADAETDDLVSFTGTARLRFTG